MPSGHLHSHVSQPAAVPVTPADTPESILGAARRELGKRDDVLGVRLGYRFRDGWITKERALVVTVRQRLTPPELRARGATALPRTYRGYAVDVTNPTLAQLLTESHGPALAEMALAQPRVRREEILYHGPEISLDKVTDRMRVLAHTSPDQGWPNLKAFLEGTKRRLVVGMYDFGAPHIVERVQSLSELAAFELLALVIQKGESVGSGTKVDDLRDQEVIDRLAEAFEGKFETVFVRLGRGNGWVASSYHVKVAVRDQSVVWLSSGNWQSSNQPNADPLNENPQRRVWLEKYNRDWHAIVEHAGVARTYETLLLNDLAENQKLRAEEALALPDLLLPSVHYTPITEERVAPFQYFAPFDEERTFVVTPIASPDNYFDEVLALVSGAQHEILIQNQTFNAPKEGHDELRELISAVLDKQRRGIRVRIIFRVLLPADARENLEALQDLGFDMADFKVQKNCHTKGIMVDGKQVMLGSQNWSNDGVSVNRDASLLFEDAALTRHFTRIFDHDWRNLATQNIGQESMRFELVTGESAHPADTVRITWKDYMEMFG